MAMQIKRQFYLQQLIDGKQNGLIKIITGIRRCGKSYLLFKLFRQHLTSDGVDDKHIISIALDDIENADLREQEESHIMENVIYNELRRRGCRVDVGMVEQRYVDSSGKWQRKQLEVDFVVNEGNQRYYIQSALAMPDKEKRAQEMGSLLRIDDSFKKMIVVNSNIKPWRDDLGILTIGLIDFLMDPRSLDR